MSQQDSGAGILVCINLRDEVIAALRGTDYERLPLITFPSHTSLSPADWKGEYLRSLREAGVSPLIFVSCGCSHPIPADRDVAHLRSPEVFLTDAEFGRLSGSGVYMVTSGFLTDLSPGMIHLKDAGISRLVHLRTRYDPDADAGAEMIAAEIGADLETYPVDLSIFSLRLRMELLSADLRAERENNVIGCQNLESKVADYTMAFDLLSDIVNATTMDEISVRIENLLLILFSPSVTEYRYTPFPDGTDGIILPIRHGNDILAWFRMDEFSTPEYIERYRNTVEFLLPVFGLAMMNARIYQQLHAANEEKDGVILRLREMQEALALANKKINLLTAITRHDILNDVTVVVAHLDLAGDLPLSDEVKATFQKLDEQMVSIQRKLEFTKDYQDMGLQAPAWHMIRSLVASVSAPILKTGSLSLLNDLPDVGIFTDPMLPKIIHNLTQNALFHARGATYLRWSAYEAGADLIISIEDDGPGVPDNRKKSIFKPSFGRSHGFGLYLVQEILAITGITIKEDGRYGEGARFLICVPEGRWRRSLPGTEETDRI